MLSGIIYSLTRKDCDTLAQQLNLLGIKTKPYHAGMTDKVREKIQREWMQDQFYVIVATIAFGMGIDKPDVRFVIHNSVPKSVEAFYQESGRAGRDGDISYSYLFYNYGDVVRLQKIMQLDRNSTKNTLDGHFENLKQMIAFAENVVDCRRYLQLLHLGEKFDRQICIQNKETTCDNCEKFSNYNNVDVTKEAKELGILVQDITRKCNFTLSYVADIYKGSKQKKIIQNGHAAHKYHGAGSKINHLDVHRILKDLILKNILADYHTFTGKFPVVYIKPGPKFNTLNASNLKITIPVAIECSVKIKSSADYPELNIPVEPQPSVSTSVVKKAAISKYKITKIKVQCHEELLEECRRLALEKNVTLSSIMNLSAIKSMSDLLPKTREEFLKIQHVTTANYKKFGEYFLKITKKFGEQLDSLQPEPEDFKSSFGHSDRDWCSPVRGTKRKSTGRYRKGAKKFKRARYNKAKSPRGKRGARQ
ncbi:hypothetical protein NQ314_018425 [Rhamnusium bicolor]|uniref:ATP-dependent DNA helicase n=1 Tax=Rhamnusium bicolor TaxID=1586634 RepID=A0AAV8WQ92_9CUCU|nr:hypothetical protein NQ314_018425 [Rhamnusium bicolor]